MSESPKTYQCRHIHTTGRRCRSASLRGENFCYYHHTTRRPAPRHTGVNPKDAEFDVPSLEDRASIRFAVAQVLARIATNQLDNKRAGLLLYGLQVAVLALPPEPRPARRLASLSDSTNWDLSTSDQYLLPESVSGPTPGAAPDQAFGSTQQSSPGPSPDLLIDIVFDPDLGPIAPIAETIPNPPATRSTPRSTIQRLLQDLNQHPQTSFASEEPRQRFPNGDPIHPDPDPTLDPDDEAAGHVPDPNSNRKPN